MSRFDIQNFFQTTGMVLYGMVAILASRQAHIINCKCTIMSQNQKRAFPVIIVTACWCCATFAVQLVVEQRQLCTTNIDITITVIIIVSTTVITNKCRIPLQGLLFLFLKRSIERHNFPRWKMF